MSVKIAVLLALTLCSSLVCCPRSVCLFFFFFKTKNKETRPVCVPVWTSSATSSGKCSFAACCRTAFPVVDAMLFLKLFGQFGCALGGGVVPTLARLTDTRIAWALSNSPHLGSVSSRAETYLRRKEGFNIKKKKRHKQTNLDERNGQVGGREGHVERQRGRGRMCHEHGVGEVRVQRRHVAVGKNHVAFGTGGVHDKMDVRIMWPSMWIAAPSVPLTRK